MPLGAARINLISKHFAVEVAAEVIRKKIGITAIGNAQVDTAQSKFGGASALFDGTEDWLQIDDNPIPSSGDFTVEFWFRPSAIGALRPIWSMRDTGGTHRGTLYINAVGGLTWWTPGVNVNYGGGNLSANTWYHIACVLDGSTGRIFVNGSGYSASTGVTVGDILEIGAAKYSGSVFGDEVIGHIDEFRVSNTARYTTSFTAPTEPFQNDENTLFLSHMDGTDASTYFEDDNGQRSKKSLVAIGNAQIDTAQYKFGGSSYLGDGTGDYLKSQNNGDYNFGTSSFTIEYFIRFNAVGSLFVPIALRPAGAINTGEWWCEITASEKKMYWGFKNQAGTQYYVNLALAGSAFVTGQWYHIALVNNAGTAQLYIDGVATGATTALSGSFGNSTTDLWVGAGAGAYSLNGWLDEVRISNTARYTTGFTPPTAPFVNDSNTLLLIHADGTDGSTVFLDDNGSGRAQVGVKALGNAQVDTAQSKFGGSSGLFDPTGSAHYLEIKDNLTAFEFGTGDFTVEGWFRFAATNADYAIYTGATTNGDLDMRRTNDNLLRIGRVNTAWDLSSSATGITANTWHHIAFTRSSGTARIFVDGTQVASGSNSINYNITTQLRIGAHTAASLGFNGYIDEFRVSSVARYTSGFTAPTEPFQNDSDTVLLLHMDGTDGSTVFIDDNGVAPNHDYGA